MIEEIKNTGSECKIEKDSKLQTHFKVENSFLPHEFLKNNYYYTFGYPSNNNHYDYTNLYLDSIFNKYAYSSMLYDQLMKARCPFFSSFNGFN